MISYTTKHYETRERFYPELSERYCHGHRHIIPGVSGGTIALITGIYERFIHAFRSFDLPAVRLLLKGDFRGFARHTDLWFLTSVFLGVLVQYHCSGTDPGIYL